MHFQEFEKNGTTHCQVVDHFVLSALSSVSSARGSGWVGGWVSEQRRHTGALPTIVCKFKFLLHQIYRQWPALLLMDQCLYTVIFWKSEIYCVKLICAPWVKGVDGLGTEDQSATCFVCQYKVWFGFGLVWFASVQEQEQVSANYL